mmetsp:Transcript_8973/g.40767  ORF Transcript_8973/g.40767 Transcript_8973/m.40767 type:complete len:204 (-) Transcript_8973:555-1166(-)
MATRSAVSIVSSSGESVTVSIVSNSSCASSKRSDENDPRCVRPALISQHSSSSSCGGWTTTTFAIVRASSPSIGPGARVESPPPMGTFRLEVATPAGFSDPPTPRTVPGFHEYAMSTLSVALCVTTTPAPSGRPASIENRNPPFLTRVGDTQSSLLRYELHSDFCGVPGGFCSTSACPPRVLSSLADAIASMLIPTLLPCCRP